METCLQMLGEKAPYLLYMFSRVNMGLQHLLDVPGGFLNVIHG